MLDKVRWGILGTAKIAVEKVIPAMQSGRFCGVYAIASRDIAKAQKVANELEIPKPYGSYEELLADPTIEAVYVPVPNNLHLEWTTKAAEAGKHVLCEKPIGLNAGEVRKMIDVRDRTGSRIQEAFMIRTHPTWTAVRKYIKSGRIGKLRAVTGFFSYFNDDESNIRNQLDLGGGGLLDIGCYCINVSRFIYDAEPTAVSGYLERNISTGTDDLASAVLEFGEGHASFTCSTALVPYQRMQFFGTRARIEVQIPFNIPVDNETSIFIDDGSDPFGKSVEKIGFEPADQYTIQGDKFSKAIMEDAEQTSALEDSFHNMAVIDAVFLSAVSGRREIPEKL